MKLVDYESFLETIYGAVGEADYWQRAVDAFSATVEGGVAQINAFAESWEDHYFYVVPGFVPADMIAEYTQHYAELDPRMAVAQRISGRMTACHEYLDVGTFERSEIVNEFLDRKSLNLRWCAAHVENPDPKASILVSMMRARDRGPFQKKELRELERLSCHLHRVARLHIDLARSNLAATRLQTTLDGLADAIFVCDREGRLLHMNRPGAEMIECGDVLNARGGTLKPAAAEASDAFGRAMDAAAQPFADDLKVDTRIALRGGPGTLPLLVRFHAMPRDLAGDTRLSRGEVLIVVRDPNRPGHHDGCALRALGFSPAETALTLALADGKTLAEHAVERGVSLETVRSQIKGAMAKAGVSRQAELVRLAMRYAG